MSFQFYTLPIQKIKKETPDCVSITFNVPENLKNVFAFKEGQNLTIKHRINGEEIRRSYSICSAPHESTLTIAVKKVDGGLFSTFANDMLTVNDTLDVMPPSGKFNAHINNTNPHYLAIAAGSGITPIISIIKHTLHTQPNSHFTLIYGSKNRNAIIFFDELENLKNKFMQRFTLINILSQEKIDADVFYGRINDVKLNGLHKIVPFQLFSAAYLCGPEEMIFAAKDFLTTNGLDPAHIHFELFTTPGQFAAKEKTTASNDDASNGPISHITIKLDDRTFSFDLAYNGPSILDAALKNGADLPYACKGGVCCTCRAKLQSGTIKMDVNYALEKEEVDQGFVLTCQSHPTTEAVFIDFDVK